MSNKNLLLEVIKEQLTKLYSKLNLSDEEFIKMENENYKEDNIKFEEDEAGAIKAAVAKGVINSILYLMED